MTTDQAITALSAGLAGAGLAALLAAARLAAPPKRLMRRNYRGLDVPAVLGGPLVIGGLSALVCVAMAGAAGWDPGRVGRVGFAAALGAGVFYVAGSLDDRRGDEADRGFGGHLAALRGGRMTGGVLKIAAGFFVAALTYALLDPVVDATRPELIGAVVLVPATANLINLLDRAPGRAGKTALLVAAPLVAFGSAAWTVAAAGCLGALIALLGKDLRERAMLGDAGANPLGAVLGLGLGLSLRGGGLWIALALVVALNVLSEKVSFSRVIEKTPGLRDFDRWGRVREEI